LDRVSLGRSHASAMASPLPAHLSFPDTDRAGRCGSRVCDHADGSPENRGGIRAAPLDDNLGASAGSVLPGIHAHRYQMLFLLAAVPSVISMVLVILRCANARCTHAAVQGLELADLGEFGCFSQRLFALGSFSYSFLLIKASSGTSPHLPVLLSSLFLRLCLLPFGVSRRSDGGR